MKTVRIGSGLGFYGDSWAPVKASIERGEVDYLCSDHLSELTLAILQKDRQKDPSLGYARDGVAMLGALYPASRERGIKWVLNAGGLNPQGCREAVAAVLKKRGVAARIAVVTGDDVQPRLAELRAAGQPLRHLDTGAEIEGIEDRLVFASAYLGARPIVDALAQGADIVITGRVADAALFLAPLVHELGWAWNDWDLLAQGLTVGHLLECSGQVTGGNFGGDWQQIPDLAHLGYGIAEVSTDGRAVLTKPPGTGGAVNFDTVREQLLYEVHDPRAYVSPDVVLDMSSLRLTDLGSDRVEITGARGSPPPDTLKIVGGYHDGFVSTVTAGYCWPNAMQKAKAAIDILRVQATEARLDISEWHHEFLGHNAFFGALADESIVDRMNEVWMRVAVRTTDPAVGERFQRLFPALALSGPPGASGFSGFAPPRALLGIWPTVVGRELIEPGVRVDVVDA